MFNFLILFRKIHSSRAILVPIENLDASIYNYEFAKKEQNTKNLKSFPFKHKFCLKLLFFFVLIFWWHFSNDKFQFSLLKSVISVYFFLCIPGLLPLVHGSLICLKFIFIDLVGV